MSAEDILKAKMEASDSPNVPRIGHLLLGLGFQILLVEEKFKDDRDQDIGDVDLAFSFEDHVFLIEVSKERGGNEKIRASFEKWSESSNLQKVQARIGLDDPARFFRIYVDTSKSSSNPGAGEMITQFRKPEEQNFILFQDDIRYFEEMRQKAGRFARYDLLSLIGTKPAQGSEPIKAIRFKMGGNEVFSFVMNAGLLLERAYVFRRRGKDLGYQRALDFDRVEEIEEKIRTRQIIAFPNSILINLMRLVTSNPPAVEGEPPTVCDVDLPSEYCSARIVDGQHRLLGIARLPDVLIRPINLQVLAFNKLDQEQEIRTFVEINDNHSRVDSNLVLDLMADFDWPAGSVQSFRKEAVHVIRKLKENNVVPLYFGGASEEK